MSRKLPIFYSALMLTAVSLFLRMTGTVFQIYLSGAIGAEGIGLLQLIMSIGMLSMTFGTAGIRTASMYLTAEEIGKNRKLNIAWVLHSCILYSIFFSCCAGVLLYIMSDHIANVWIGSSASLPSIRLLAYFLPVCCLNGVLSGCYTAAGKIKILSGIEIAEQFISAFTTILFLLVWANSDLQKSCLSVVLGSSIGSCFTLISLVYFQFRDQSHSCGQISFRSRLVQTAVPLALADNLKAGISSAENLMVPKRLALCAEVQNPMAVFGTIGGMVFPILMFPCSVLFGLSEILIPEMARCNAAGSKRRIQYLAGKALHIALIYGCFCGGILHILAGYLCRTFFGSSAAGSLLKIFSLFAPMLYCDAVTDAMTKGLGQQKICVKFNIITSSLDLILLFILLPVYGVRGYIFSFFFCHLINFCLSLGRLLKIAGPVITASDICKCLLSAVAALLCVSFFSSDILKILCFIMVFFSLLVLWGSIGLNDIKWLCNLIKNGGLS